MSNGSVAYKQSSRTPDWVVKAAIDSARKWGVPASVTLAQWSLESDYGTSDKAQYARNPFGIKATDSDIKHNQFYEAWTTEENPQTHRKSRQKVKFKRFGTVLEAFDYHGKLLASLHVYRRAMAFCKNPDAFADALQGVYAGDHTYAKQLKARMKLENYYQYDVAQGPQNQNRTPSFTPAPTALA